MITLALQRLRPNSHWSLDGTQNIIWEPILDESGNTTGKERPVNLFWFDTNTEECPTRDEIYNEVERIRQEQESIRYQLLRQSKYPNLADFADAYYWLQKGDGTKMEEYFNKIEAVKSEYPKP